MKKNHVIMVIVTFGLLTAVSAQSVTNFASPKSVYDFEFTGDVVWAATSGGLYHYNSKTGEKFLRPATSEFPDPSIRALCRDGAGNLWAGTRNGYLLSRDVSGNEQVNYSYVAAGWSISDIIAAGAFLVIASDKGVSLFDMGKRTVVKNATRFGSFTSPQVYTLHIQGSTLFIGGESGMAHLKVPVDSISRVNFYDPSIWAIDSSDSGPVRSFYVEDGKVRAYNGASGWFNNTLVLSDSMGGVRFFNKDTAFIPFYSKVTVIKERGANCWIGTEDNFFTPWVDGRFDMHPIPGPTFSAVHRVMVDRSGTLWVLPYGNPAASPWWLGINSFNGSTWYNFDPLEYPQMGHMMGSSNAFGILQTQDGSMWFGFDGGQIKRYNPAADGWSHYCVYGNNGDGNGAFVKARGKCPTYDWGKCDALAQDSAGYMWISSWNNADGALICYKPDPREDDDLTVEGKRIYRRFPPKGAYNISAIAIDKQQHVIYGSETGELTIAEKVNDPVTDPVGLRVIRQFGNLQKVLKVVAFADGTSLVVTANGVFRYDPAEPLLSSVDGFGKNVTTLTAENETIFWYGTGEGVVRYDQLNNEKTLFGRANGLVSNQINDIFVDKKRGNVWIATDRGITRLALGFTTVSASKKSVTVFPNPCSRNAHAVVYFRDVPTDGVVSIHALNGNLVGKPVLLRKGDGGASYQWMPPSSLSPGTYFYSVVSPSKRVSGKIMLTP